MNHSIKYPIRSSSTAISAHSTLLSSAFKTPAPASLANNTEVMTVRTISSAGERDVLSLLHSIHAVLDEYR